VEQKPDNVYRLIRHCWMCTSDGSSESHLPCPASWERSVLSTWASLMARSSYKAPSVQILFTSSTWS